MDENRIIEGSVDSRWAGLVSAGGWSALVIAALFLSELVIYLVSAAPSLADAAGWLALFENNRLLALIDFGLLEFFGLLLFIPMFLGLYAALKPTGEGSMLVGLALALMGVGINFATGQLFPLISISGLYASAAEAQRPQLLALAQAALAQSAQGGIGGGVQGGVPLAVAGLIISVVMLRGRSFGKATAIVGLLANAVAALMYMGASFLNAPEGSPFFGPFFILSVVWFALIGAGLLRLAANKHA